MAPKRKSSDAGSAFKPKRSRDVLSISKKVKILDMIEIKKKSYVEIAKLYGKNEKHDFYCSVIPWNCTWYCTVQVLYFFIAVSSFED